MGSYIPNTSAEQLEMLKEIGFNSFDELFDHIPAELKLTKELDIPKGVSEFEVREIIESLANKNKVFDVIFRGAGAYNHFIPAIVKSVLGRSELISAYTPYQPEISQGVLQGIFEYQTMICELTGMDASNASVYDGASATAEAVTMTLERKRSKIYISETVDPRIISVVKTYGYGKNVEFILVPAKDGVTDAEQLKALMDKDAAGLIVQQPNYYGILEDATTLGEIAHEVGAKYIMNVNPTSLGILKTPRAYGADIAVGDGQPLGVDLSYGGPYVGFMATTEKLIRKLPGRICGETVDSQGERGFVLTLQAREQHIRREKSSSNICSNQALIAFQTAVYLSTVGPQGLKQVATSSAANAHYLQAKLAEAGLTLKFDQPFFHEFVTTGKSSEKVLAALEEAGILGGLPLSDTEILWCATEMNNQAQIERVAEIVKGVN